MPVAFALGLLFVFWFDYLASAGVVVINIVEGIKASEGAVPKADVLDKAVAFFKLMDIDNNEDIKGAAMEDLTTSPEWPKLTNAARYMVRRTVSTAFAASTANAVRSAPAPSPAQGEAVTAPFYSAMGPEANAAVIAAALSEATLTLLSSSTSAA